MPNKYPTKKGWHIPKQKYKISNWAEYNNSLRKRGNISVWLSLDIIDKWIEKDRIYDGTGTPKYYTDFAIITCHEIRQVYRLPLRQCQGFIDSLFEIMGLPLKCPDYSTLSTRLKELKIKSPRYSKNSKPEDGVHAIAIDSSGLKKYGLDEWHNEKHHLSNKASWCKLHIAVNEKHYFEGCTLTNRFMHDDTQVQFLLEQIKKPIDHFTADGAYDETPVYDQIIAHSSEVDIVIPPQQNAVLNKNASIMRNRNIQEIDTFGRMNWQHVREYGRRNYSELAIQRYKRILGRAMHARKIERQKQEAMIGCGVLNKMTSLGMPKSYRVA